MDADDAVEFFEAVRERFGTDLSALDREWRAYFGDEGGGFTGFALLPGMGVGGLLGWWLGLSWGWGFALAVGIGIGSLWVLATKPGARNEAPVTVSDLVAAVEAGAWPALDRTA